MCTEFLWFSGRVRCGGHCATCLCVRGWWASPLRHERVYTGHGAPVVRGWKCERGHIVIAFLWTEISHTMLIFNYLDHKILSISVIHQVHVFRICNSWETHTYKCLVAGIGIWINNTWYNIDRNFLFWVQKSAKNKLRGPQISSP